MDSGSIDATSIIINPVEQHDPMRLAERYKSGVCYPRDEVTGKADDMENLMIRTLRANLSFRAPAGGFYLGNVSAIDREKGVIYIKPSGVLTIALKPGIL